MILFKSLEYFVTGNGGVFPFPKMSYLLVELFQLQPFFIFFGFNRAVRNLMRDQVKAV